jgi:hypothetical protein
MIDLERITRLLWRTPDVRCHDRPCSRRSTPVTMRAIRVSAVTNVCRGPKMRATSSAPARRKRPPTGESVGGRFASISRLDAGGHVAQRPRGTHARAAVVDRCGRRRRWRTPARAVPTAIPSVVPATVAGRVLRPAHTSTRSRSGCRSTRSDTEPGHAQRSGDGRTGQHGRHLLLHSKPLTVDYSVRLASALPD